MPIQWNTVAIPFAQGIQPSTRGRLLDQLKLLRAENCVYKLDNGPEKRNGHIGRPVITGAAPAGNTVVLPPAPPPRQTYSFENPNLPTQWLHGWGLLSEDAVPPTSDVYAVSEDPRVGLLFGQAARDAEVMSWDGNRILSYASEQISKFGEFPYADSPGYSAVMPALRAKAFAKTAGGQNAPDAADNGVVRTAAWIDADATPTSVSWVVEDSKTGATLVVGNDTFQAPKVVRVITIGPWTHILVSDTTEPELLLRSFHQDTPGTTVDRSLGVIHQQCFDVRKVSEFQWVVCRTKTDWNTAANNLEMTVLNADGSTVTTWAPNTNSEGTRNFAIATNRFEQVGLLWMDNTATFVRFRAYNLGGGILCPITTLTSTLSTGSGTLTLSDEYITDPDITASYWVGFFRDNAVSGGAAANVVYSHRIEAKIGSSSNQLIATAWNAVLGSHAFRVGQRAYAWLASDRTLQKTWFLCDRGLKPIGKLDYGVSNPTTASGSTAHGLLPGVNWHTPDSEHPVKDRLVFTGCLSYKQRVESSVNSPIPNGVFAEPSIRFYTLDFLPRLRSAQAGRSAYFAGAQLWQYDGLLMAEAGFHMAPEGTNFTPAAGGSMSSTGDYRYRIDCCYKNLQGEEIRSWSLISAAVTMGGSDTQVTLRIPTMGMTRKQGSYFLVFRTELNLTSYYLVSSRNPADSGAAANGFVENDDGVAHVSFIDRLSDANARVREFHPANFDGFIEPLPAPACEIVAAGRDRLWLAGGELNAGEVAPSRLFFPGECPAFSPAINIQVDRSVEPITAIGFTGKIAAVFRRTGAYTIEGDGPDNVGQGVFFPAQPALSAVGAIGQESLASADMGLFFQSPVGIRLLSPSGQLITGAAGGVVGLGVEVDPLAAVGDYSAAVTVPSENQIRWYSRDSAKPTLVYDYAANSWVTWTGVDCAGASFWHPGNTVILSRLDGRLWRETPGLYVDDDRTYEMIVKTAWLHGGNLGDFQKIRRMVLFGEAVYGLSLRLRWFYDERDFYDEEQIVLFPGTPGDDLLSQWNTSEWGDGVWGGNVGQLDQNSWGDANTVAGGLGLFFRDDKFRIRKRPHRQKCSVFAIEFSDQGHTGGGFIPAVLALELGQRAGLDRVPGSPTIGVYGEI